MLPPLLEYFCHSDLIRQLISRAREMLPENRLIRIEEGLHIDVIEFAHGLAQVAGTTDQPRLVEGVLMPVDVMLFQALGGVCPQW